VNAQKICEVVEIGERKGIRVAHNIYAFLEQWKGATQVQIRAIFRDDIDNNGDPCGDWVLSKNGLNLYTSVTRQGQLDAGSKSQWEEFRESLSQLIEFIDAELKSRGL
jgi:hypothetical protein